MSRSERGPELVVGVGASAGGLEAFKRLLAALPNDTGMAFVLVQHLDPTHESLLSELLAARTEMPVRDAEQGERLAPNTVYVIRPDCALAVRGGCVELSEPTLHRGVRLPVDHLFRSLAREYGPRSVGIVLSGAGSDGSAGLRDIKGAGGLALVQEPDSGGQAGMPSSAIDTGVVDLVLEIEDMPAALERFASLPPAVRVDPSREAEALEGEDGRTDEDGDRAGDRTRDGCEGGCEGGRGRDPRERDDTDRDASGRDANGAGPWHRVDERELDRLGAMLEAQLGFELGVYKRGTVERRVLRRMLLSGFEDVGEWLEHLRERADEQRRLVSDLMIGVTSFFRDPEVYGTLRERVIDPLVEGATEGAEVRVWIAGCATGEEAYSIGMELLDAAERAGRRIEPQIFATDVDREALGVARAGLYPAAIAERVSERRLRRYFEPVEGRGYRVRSTLRDLVSFASHDLTRDPPFSRMDLVSCRNVLIYLTREIQEHVLETLHFALGPEGHLLLGTSESTGAKRESFTTVSKAQRLYAKSGRSRLVPRQRARRAARGSGEDDGEGRDAASETGGGGVAAGAGSGRAARPDPLHRAVLEACAPPTVVVAEDGAVLFVHGELGPYLRFPQGGRPRLEIGECLRPAIATRARGALYRCRNAGEEAVATTSPGVDGSEVRIVARPAPRVGEGVVVLSFEAGEAEQGRARAAADERAAGHETAVVEQLERELASTREDLRSTVEELETSNEELRSSNEETMSMNEELQSGNEELEATTEELRSLNEELTTVNAQLRGKVDQLEQAKDDLGNFFASARLPIVFLDDGLRIKRFTPAAAELLRIDDGDVGRFAPDISRELLHGDLEREALEVLDRLVARGHEVRLEDGRWFTRRILPYRTESRRIEGVVVTLVDVTETKRATERLAARERQQAVIARLGLAALREPDLQGFLEQAVREVAATLDLDFCKILELQPGAGRLLLRAGIGWREGIVGEASVENDDGSQAGFTLLSRAPVVVDDLAAETRFSGPELLTSHEVTSGLSCAILDGADAYGVFGGHTREARAFSPEDATFLQAVANVVGSAVSRQQQRVRLALERGLARALVDARDVEELFGRLWRHLAEELDAELVLVRAEGASGRLPGTLLYAGGGPERRAEIERAFGTAGDDAVPGGGAPDDAIVRRVRERGCAVWATDIGTPALADDRRAGPLGFRSALGFAVRSRGRAFGTVALYSRTRLLANEALLRALETLGESIGDFVVRLELERRDARLAAISESSRDAILSYDPDGRITEWLQGAERLFGFTSGEMVGFSVERLIPAECREAARALRERVAAGEPVEPFETVRATRDDRRLEVSVTSSPIRDRDGAVRGISSIERDIGRLKDTERRLIAADRQKDEFLAMLGHELRNPLASIRSAAELLGLDAGAGSEQHRALDILERQSAHMARLLDGLLDVSRIVQGKIELERRRVDLAGICREAIDDTAGRLEGRRLALRTSLPDAPVEVDADRVRLVQVVDNLLANAIKFTPDGGEVVLGLVRRDGRAELCVRDTGIGIDATLLPHVFDVFRQAPRESDRREGGLGLGLALVRSLVELHGGTVGASSEGAGRGAEFRVSLPSIGNGAGAPSAADPDVRADAGDAPHASGVDVLIVEDNLDTAHVMGQLLERFGHRVRIAHEGREALRSAAEAPPELVVCDLGLPGELDGLDVARALREAPGTRGAALVALSGYGRPEDRARSLEAGFDLHLTKPAGAAELREAIARARDSRRTGANARTGD